MGNSVAPHTATLNFLLAEDNPDDVFLLRHAFSKASVSSSLHAVSDGVEALAYLAGEGSYKDRTTYPLPDVLLLDISMPRMNGFEVLQHVRENPRCSRLLVHMLTASSLNADVQRAYELHANGYALKPNRLNDLVAFVKAMHDWHGFICFPPSDIPFSSHLNG